MLQLGACSMGCSTPQRRGLCSKASSFLALQHLRRPLGVPLAARPRLLVTRTAASAAQPVVRAASRLLVRALPANALAAIFAAARSGRMGPLVVVGLLAYSVGVTIYANSARRQAEAASAAAAAAAPTAQGGAATASLSRSQLASVDSSVLASLDLGSGSDGSGGSGGSLSSLSVLASVDAAPESMAEALAAAALAPPPPPEAKEAKRRRKEEQMEVCKVCGGTGEVSYENHMQSYDGTVCPCCLGKGRVRHNSNNLISALLSFDP